MNRILLTLLLTVGFTASGASRPLPAGHRLMTAAELLPLLRDSLIRTYPNLDGTLELEPARMPTAAAVPAGRDISVRILFAPPVPTAFLSARYELRMGDKQLGEWTAFFKARVMRDVWVAQGRGQRGETLDTLTIARQRRDVINLRQPFWDGRKADASLCLKQNLLPGSIVFDYHVRRTPVVRRGQLVDAVIRAGTLYVAVQVEVMQDGAVGETIRVRNTKSRREIRARVIDGGTVQVDF